MRCSTRPNIDLSDTCTSTATHMLLWSMPDPHKPQGARKRYTEPVCKPCGDVAYRRRPALKARVVPLHIYTPTPAFKDIAGGHRLVDHPEHGAQCHDCGRTGSTDQFKLAMLHGCPARPESVNSRELPQAGIGSDVTRDELAGRWWKYVTHEVGMGVGDWRLTKDDRLVVATFTFRDREYVLMHSPSIPYVWAEKRENRGYPAPELINPEYAQTYRQVAFHFHTGNYNGAMNFACYTPGCEDVILYYPEGQTRAVLRISGLNFPESTHLAQVTDAVCDAFGPVADLIFQTRIYQ
ncbi:hypothetical protein [Streptomyces sp. NBC_01451]|uniref:hypothetical protein n=1 Tax=Streptomyces sp. NBC_01451 TaxID=2903872 RepID=UPI002E36C28C|nr:hypothetical protein [Streptomyces sp. NBC_01451]